MDPVTTPDYLDADVIIVGAGPTGLMLAGELGRAGVSALVLERRHQPNDVAKAGGLNGQILDVLRYRGLMDRVEAAGPGPGPTPRPAPRFPWGGIHVDFTGLAEPPMEAVPLPQPQLEALLAELALEVGAEIRRGVEVVGLRQDADRVTADVRHDGGTMALTARYLVGCDGASGRTRDLAGIAFPGITYPEVQRLGSFTVPESVTLLDNGDIEVEGVGRIAFGFTPTERGIFALGSATPGALGVFTSEDDPTGYDDEQPMTVAEMHDSVHRVLGREIPLGDPTRMVRFTFHAREVERFCDGRILLAGDAAHLFPAPGTALNAGLVDTVNLGWKLAAAVEGWAPDGLLDSYHDERHVAATRTLLHTRAQVALRRGYDPAADALRDLLQELLVDEQPLRRLGAMMAGTSIRYPIPNPNQHPFTGGFAPDLALTTDQGPTSVAELMPRARPLFVDLADHAELRAIAQGWQHRVDIQRAELAPTDQADQADGTDDRPADAVLIRPDLYVAWAAAADEPPAAAAAGLRAALELWFGSPET